MSDEIFEITLTDIANGGQALGRYGKKTIFVPYTIPGETIQAQVSADYGRYAFANGIKVLDVSVDRVLPRCPHFGAGRCGFCTWQHIDYPAQLALKSDIVSDQLSRIGGLENIEVPLTLPSATAWRYRHAATLYPAGTGRFGYRSTDGQNIFLIEECHIITPELLALIEQMDFDLPTLTRVMILDDGRDDRMLILSTNDDEAPSLEVDFKSSINLLLSDSVPVNLVGGLYLTYEILGRRYRVTAGSFFRSNIPQIETLIQVIQKWLKFDHHSILDLYSGVGVLAGAFARQVDLITCVENYASAVADAEHNLDEFDHIDLIEGDVIDVLPSLEESYYAALLDPPEDGIQKEVIDLLVEMALPHLIYISQEPATLARDARRLVDRGGYTLKQVQPIDFEPQTHRVVIVAHLTKES